jgi:serine/threonine-protein kinase
MSPEQIVAAETVDGRSDVFAAAVVLYELLTGACPFARKGKTEAIDAILRHDVDPDPRIEPPLFLEIRRALRKPPNERHASAAEMPRALCTSLGETERTIAAVLERPLVALRSGSQRVR